MKMTNQRLTWDGEEEEELDCTVDVTGMGSILTRLCSRKIRQRGRMQEERKNSLSSQHGEHASCGRTACKILTRIKGDYMRFPPPVRSQNRVSVRNIVLHWEYRRACVCGKVTVDL